MVAGCWNKNTVQAQNSSNKSIDMLFVNRDAGDVEMTDLGDFKLLDASPALELWIARAGKQALRVVKVTV